MVGKFFFNEKTLIERDSYIARQTMKRTFIYKTTMNNNTLQDLPNYNITVVGINPSQIVFFFKIP